MKQLMNVFTSVILLLSATILKAQAPYSVPYVQNFNASSADWTMPLISNGNYFKWVSNTGLSGSGGMRMKLPDPANFIVSPAISLVAGKTYTFSFAAKMDASTAGRRQKVAFNTNTTLTGATVFYDDVMPFNGYTALPYQTFNPTFTVPVSGNYYFSYQAYQLGYVFNYFDDVRIEETFFPTVNLTSPLNNTGRNEDYYTDSTKITLTATAADADGSVSKVQFYNGTTLLGEDNSAPYELVVKDLLPSVNDYIFTAKAIDNRGNTTTSAAANYSIKFRDGSISKFIQWDFNANNPFGAGYDYWTFVPRFGSNTEFVIRSGTLGFHGTNAIENNSNAVGSNYAASPSFSLQAGEPYKLEFVAGNGGGIRDYRFLLSTSTSLADTVKLIDTARIFVGETFLNIRSKPFTISTSGVYHLIFFHKSSGATANIKCRFDNIRIIGNNLNEGPIAEMTKPSVALTTAENTQMRLAASFADKDGSIQKIEYYANGVKVTESNIAPFEAIWSNIPAGVYSLLAKPFDNQGAYGTSNAVTVTVLPNSFKSSGFIGSTANDTVRTALIKENNDIVFAMNVGSSFNPAGATKYYVNGATDNSFGAIVILAPDGKTVKSVTRVADRVADMSKDQNDFLYIACAQGGVIKINPTATTMIWRTDFTRVIHRIDVGPSGKSVILETPETNTDDGTLTSGTMYLLDKNGAIIRTLGGISQYSGDVAIHEPSETAIGVGFKNFNTLDAIGGLSLPVFVPVVRAYNFDGSTKYVAYDWSADSNDPRWLNRSNNNMADARLNRCAIGKDGLLYIAGQIYGGNHIFRYQPFDNMATAAVVGGDSYHTMSNTGTEIHIYFGRFTPATGNVLLQQVITNRLDNGVGNSIAIETGAIEADAAGNVYIAGASASGLPLSVNHLPGTYTGGAFLMNFNNAFGRTSCIRLDTTGVTRTVAAKGTNQYVFAGSSNSSLMYSTQPHFQAGNAGVREGFFGLVNNNSCSMQGSQQSIATSNYSTNLLAATHHFNDASCNAVATVIPTETETNNYLADSLVVKLWIEPTATGFVKRHYEITPVDANGNIIATANTKKANVTLYFTQDEFNEYNAINVDDLPSGPSDLVGIANLRVEKYAGTSSNGTGLPSSYGNGSISINPNDNNIVWNAVQARWEVTFSVEGFSGFFVKTPSGALPLQKLDFTGTAKQLENVLVWKTEQEVNIKKYVLQKSTDAVNFEDIYEVLANNNTINSYTFNDKNVTNAVNYYRIKVIEDNNSNVTFSKVVKLDNRKEQLTVYPVPAKNNITIVSSKQQNVMITNVVGVVVKNILVQAKANTIDISQLTNGIYFIKGLNTETIKVVKQ
jgi:hypothetical protein